MNINIRFQMSKCIGYFSGLMTAVTVSMVEISPDAIARSVQWYADHIEQAKTTQASCNVRVKNGGTLPDDVLEECRNANDAMLHAHHFTPSKPMSW